MPAESTAPHLAPVHPLPETIQLTERSGWPAAEFTVAEKERAAPSSTGIACGETDTETSLVIVTDADPLLELSAELVAWTLTTAGTGKSDGAV